MYDALIVVNGDIPNLSLWQDIQYRSLICTDGAALNLLNSALNPDIIIGDMDSISESHPIATVNVLEKRFPRSKILLIEDQNTTDFEKALEYVAAEGLQKVICIGAFGKHADHSIYNLVLLNRFKNVNQLVLLHTVNAERQWIFPLQQRTTLSSQAGDTFSILPLSEATISTTGLQWELTNTVLSQTGKMSVRNVVLNQTLTVECVGNAIGFLTTLAAPQIHHQP